MYIFVDIPISIFINLISNRSHRSWPLYKSCYVYKSCHDSNIITVYIFFFIQEHYIPLHLCMQYALRKKFRHFDSIKKWKQNVKSHRYRYVLFKIIYEFFEQHSDNIWVQLWYINAEKYPNVSCYMHVLTLRGLFYRRFQRF